MKGNESQPPFVAITETWLKSYITDSQISIEDYCVYRSDRPNRVGGGCLLYVNSKLLITDTHTYEDKYNNLVMCYNEDNHCLIAAVYRPPDSPRSRFKDLLNSMQSKIDELSANRRVPDLFITGDFNFPNIDWENGSSTYNESEELLMNFIDSNFLTQVIRKPTRSSSILDLVITNKPHYVLETNSQETILSDHNLVELMLGFNFLEKSIQSTNYHKKELDKWSFRAANYHEAEFSGMNEEFSAINWTELYHLCEDDTDGSLFLELFRLTVLQVTLHHAPPKVQATGSHHSKAEREKYTLKRRRRKLNAEIDHLQQMNPDSQKLPKLVDKVNLLAYDINEAIINDLNAKEARAVETIKSNPRYFYSYAKRFSKTKSTVSPLRNGEGKITNDPQSKAEILQEQYDKVFSNPDDADVAECLTNVNPKLNDNTVPYWTTSTSQRKT